MHVFACRAIKRPFVLARSLQRLSGSHTQTCHRLGEAEGKLAIVNPPLCIQSDGNTPAPQKTRNIFDKSSWSHGNHYREAVDVDQPIRKFASARFWETNESVAFKIFNDTNWLCPRMDVPGNTLLQKGETCWSELQNQENQGYHDNPPVFAFADLKKTFRECFDFVTFSPKIW